MSKTTVPTTEEQWANEKAFFRAIETRIAEHVLGVDFGYPDHTGIELRDKTMKLTFGIVYGHKPGQPKENPFISHEAIAEMYREGKISRQSFIREYMGYWPPEDEMPRPFPEETEGAFDRRMREWRRREKMRDQINYKAEPIPARKEDDLPSVMAMGMREVEKYRKHQEAITPKPGDTERGVEEMMKTMQAGRETPLSELQKKQDDFNKWSPGHSPGTEMFIEAQRKARPKQLVEQAVKQNEEALATKELEKAMRVEAMGKKEVKQWIESNDKAREHFDLLHQEHLKGKLRELEKAQVQELKAKPLPDLYSPHYCKKCGHARGCMCPREDKPAGEMACTHPSITFVRPEMWDEMKIDKTLMGDKVYACRSCLKLFTIMSLDGK